MSLFICNKCGCVENTNCCTKGLLCSECNTGEWHGEFAKVKATEAEIIMGEQLQGDEKNVFTFHPLWHLYNNDPDNFNIEILKRTSIDAKETMDSTEYAIRNSIDDSFKNMFGGGCETYVRSEPKIGRNDLCKCGSGRKYKKCCLTRGE